MAIPKYRCFGRGSKIKGVDATEVRCKKSEFDEFFE